MQIILDFPDDLWPGIRDAMCRQYHRPATVEYPDKPGEQMDNPETPDEFVTNHLHEHCLDNFQADMSKARMEAARQTAVDEGHTARERTPALKAADDEEAARLAKLEAAKKKQAEDAAAAAVEAVEPSPAIKAEP